MSYTTGALLTLGMGPKYYVQQEVQIPDGSMFIPGKELFL
jgi:hypothetical protein